MKKEEITDHNQLISKFLAKEISDNELIELRSWLIDNEENRRRFDVENELWQETDIRLKYEHFNTDTAWENISGKLDFRSSSNNRLQFRSKSHFRFLIAAASLLFFLSIGGFGLWIKSNRTLQHLNSAITTIQAKEGDKSYVFLPDSSRVVLNSGSKLQYDGKYNADERIVRLSGEAFFDVSANPERPFIVETDNVNIIARGTRFNVFSYPEIDRIETTLEEGEVLVSVKGHDDILLQPGHQVIYFRSSDNTQIREVVAGTYTAWIENKLKFKNTAFEEVMRSLSRKYNVKIEITNRELYKIKYTATFIDESIEEVMEMLSAVSPIEFQIYNRTSEDDEHYLKPRVVIKPKRQLNKIK